MTITLYLEIKGGIEKKEEIPYAMKQTVADTWRRMYPGKKLLIYYKVESKLNYEPERNEATDGGSDLKKVV